MGVYVFPLETVQLHLGMGLKEASKIAKISGH